MRARICKSSGNGPSTVPTRELSPRAPLDITQLYRREKRAFDRREAKRIDRALAEARLELDRQLAAMVPKRGRPKATTARSRI